VGKPKRRNRDVERGERLLAQARAGQEPGLDSTGLLMLIMAVAVADEHPQSQSARSLIGKLISVGLGYRKRPTVADLQPVLGNLAAFAAEAWEEVRLLAASYSRWALSTDLEGTEQQEEGFWRELAFLRVLMKPGSDASAKWSSDLIGAQARRFRTPADPKGEDSAAEALLRLLERDSARRVYEPSGDPTAALAYFQKAAKGLLLDQMTQAPAKTPASTFRRWRGEHNKAVRGKITLSGELMQLYGQLFGVEPVDPQTAALLAERVREAKHRSQAQRPVAEGAVTIGALANDLGVTKQRVREAFRAARRKAPQLGRKTDGTWLLDAEAVRAVCDQLGR